MKLLIVMIFFANALLAQYPPFALSGDGSQIHFQSELLLKSDPAALAVSRSYRYQPGEPVVARVPSGGRAVTAAFVSSDGQTIGTYEYTACFGSCSFAIPRHSLHLNRKGKEFDFSNAGELRLSRNGRFLLDAGFPNVHPGPRLYDLDSDRSWPVAKLFPLSFYSALSDEGLLVSTPPTAVAGLQFGYGNTVMLTAPGQEPRKIYEGATVYRAAITPDGRYVFVLAGLPGRRAAILELSLPAATQRQIWEGDPGSEIESLVPDQDGSRLLLHRNGQIALWDRASGEWRQIERPNSRPVTGALLSDDGQTILSSEGDSSLYKLQIATNSWETLYSPMPSRARAFGGSALPGSLLQYWGTGFSPDMRVEVDGTQFPLIESDGTTFKVQVPWEYSRGGPSRGGLQITLADSPFLLREAFSLDTRPQPRLVTRYIPNRNNNQDLAALQQDFSGFVSQSSPAPAGSTIHMYLTGLGPLDRPLKTLEAGPSDPPARPVTELACYIYDKEFKARGLVLPFIAYAPGLVGVYQVDATIPEDWPAGEQRISCVSADLFGSIAQVWTSR